MTPAAPPARPFFEAAAVGIATVLMILAMLLSAAFGWLAKRQVNAGAPLLWALCALVGGAAGIDSRALVYFGRHAYEPGVLGLVLPAVATDHAVIDPTHKWMALGAWAGALVLLTLFGLAARGTAFIPRWLAFTLLGVLVVGAVREMLPFEQVAPRSPALDAYRAALFLRTPSWLPLAPAVPTAVATPDYPRAPLVPATHGERPDVLLIVVDSLRAAAFAPVRMPNLWRYAASSGSFVGESHYAAAACTETSLVSMLYGTNPALAGRLSRRTPEPPSAPLAWLRESGYRTELHASLPLANAPGIAGLRASFDEVEEATDGTVVERDARLIEHALDAPTGVARKPRFVVLLLGSTRQGYAFPPDRTPFQPSLEALRPDTDVDASRIEVQNRYLNAVAYVDTLLGALLGRLTREGKLGATRVVVTGDHGEEFFERGHFGHASSLVDEQLHVPFVAWGFQGLDGRTSEPTSHESLLPTILESLAPGIALDDAGMGRPFFAESPSIALAGECLPGSRAFVAVAKHQRVRFDLRDGELRIAYVRDESGTILPHAEVAAPLIGRVRARLGALGPPLVFAGAAWPCPAREIAGRTARFCEDEATWPEARDACSARGMLLATVTREEDVPAWTTAVAALGSGTAWVGLNDLAQEGRPLWADDTMPKVRTEPPAGDEPSSPRADCVVLTGRGTFEARVCEERHTFACTPR